MGKLIIAGGNVKASEKSIYSRFLTLAGKKDAKILVVVTASENPLDSFEYFSGRLAKLGDATTVMLPLSEIPEAVSGGGFTGISDESLLPCLDGVTGVWFTGGDQMRTVRLLLNGDNGGDSPILAGIRQILARGGVIGGSSAGAAVMSLVMIGAGSDDGVLNYPVCTDPALYDGEMDAQGRLLLTKGLGFVTDAVIDQHFDHRARLWRLIKAMELSDTSLGYGISEDTALEYDTETKAVSVLGSAFVVQLEKSADGFRITRLYK